MAQDTISEVERGLRRPHATTIRKLAKALDVEVEDITGGVPTVPKVLAPPSLEWALAASSEEFDGWVKTANLHDILTLNYELSEAVARESFGSDRHSFMWERVNKVIARFQKLAGYMTEPEASKERRARQAQRDAEDAASEAG